MEVDKFSSAKAARIPEPIVVPTKKARGILKLLDDEELIRFNSSKLKHIFKCSICQDTLVKTKTVMECAHRFCCECIEKCLRTMKMKFCPQCRAHIPSRRSLRDDPLFDYLIMALKIQRQEDESDDDFDISQYTTSYEKLRKKAHQNTFKMLNEKEGCQRTIISYPPSIPIHSTHEHMFPSSSVDALLGCNIENFDFLNRIDDCINFSVKKLPEEKSLCELERSYIRSSAHISVPSVKKFIALKLCCSPSSLDILILETNTKTHYKVLEDSDKFTQIIDAQRENGLFDRDKDFVLYYRLHQTLINQTTKKT
mmetsp:Transcript_7664/g.10047  ORF Transcript_7664/g.10047 Transcript_7664/m.10047 type:complete len:311 (+) Transcript_7664:75-1007(+)|eukprot:CAMPEP_0204862946 /NCGR_PEP_ID=MMETSP1348-20121228/2947_1 /ASSEMBLY_ACC=CAM_ASM_000700 /TAXON_ID=215587 /ORGANISM="Aplanochytrium stocchinoi, Strain GSBS06" /LENGTH=310 /DNA_ID=CAMNT_0052013135 /DNA_START=44 /DNA_END=976 /DNA_ORIENTATION=-